ELLGRLTQDWDLIHQTFWPERTPAQLSGVAAQAGDPHHGNRSVAILFFSDGRRLVYKPTDLRIAREVLNFFQEVNRCDSLLELPVRRLLVQDGYAWEEYVHARTCENTAEIRRYYFRYGMLLRLLQLLGARDFWLDNLISSGEYPVFVDLEMAIQPA